MTKNDMNEEFVTYQQARLLKECGFDWKCDRCYDIEGNLWSLDKPMGQSRGNSYSLAPMQALAQKWLRDKKGIDIEVTVIINATGRLYSSNICYKDVKIPTYKRICNNAQTYESALSAGIDASLELIKQK